MLIRFRGAGSADGVNARPPGARSAVAAGLLAAGPSTAGPSTAGPSAAGPSTTGPSAADVAVDEADGTGTSAASLPSRQSTNWPSSLVDTSLIMPLPNCAILPEIFRSVSTLTTVLEPSARHCAVIAAAALPAPRTSRPVASMTARWFTSSLSVNRAVPAYSEVIGPTLTFTLPE